MMKILFFGTPDFALFSLRALVEGGEDVIGVVTQPDKPSGRGYTLTPPPVKVYAEERHIPVYQPNTLRGDEFAETLAGIDPDLIIVTAYGKILPQNVLDYPKYGCINVHGSILPEYRGAAPMQQAIIDGKTETGITTIRMDAGMDTGNILKIGKIAIGPDDNFETMHDKLGLLSQRVLTETLAALKDGTLTETVQDGSLATYTKKIEKADCLIDFTKPAKVLHDLIRGLSPFPLAFTFLPDGKLLKIPSARISDRKSDAPAGTVVSVGGGTITVACGSGSALDLLSVLPEGKKRMPASDFINGRKIAVGDLLGKGGTV